jgi:hypothetical protein
MFFTAVFFGFGRHSHVLSDRQEAGSVGRARISRMCSWWGGSLVYNVFFHKRQTVRNPSS